MANFAIIRVSFADGIVVTHTEWDTLDGYTAAMIDGDGGGTWSPTAQILIGDGGLSPEFAGQGSLWLAGPWSLGSSGGFAAVATTPAASGVKFTFGDGDFFELAPGHSGATRTMSEQILNVAVFVPATANVGGPTTSALQTLYDGTWFAVPLPVHDGATLSSVVVKFEVGATHANTPANMPQIRVVRVDSSGNKTSLASSAQGADGSGWIAFPTPASGALWYAAGATQTWTVTCDENNVIDATTYTYWVEIEDESGLHAFAVGAGNCWEVVEASFTAIPDTRPQ
jgi:hypothetical protein